MLAGHLIPAGSMFAFLAAHRAEVFRDAGYADLFAPPGLGRPSLPATQMAAVLTLQTLHDYSDRETAEAVRFDVRWKAAIGAALDDAGFDPSSLVYWRNRIAKSDRPHRVNNAVKVVVQETGVLRGRRRRAVDSTILADAVATQDTVTQLVSAVRKVAREVPGAAERAAAVCTGHDYSKPGKPKIDWDDPAAKDALVTVLVNDANALVEAFAGAELDDPAASALALLALVAGQDVEPAEGSDGTGGRWRIAQKVAEDRVISAVDPDARHTRKSPEARRDGYRAHLAADPETGIITDEKLTRASGDDNSDPAVAAEFLAAEAGQASSGPEDGPAPARTAPALPGRRSRQPPGQPAVMAARRNRWPGTAIPPTAPGTCAARSPTPGTRPSSSPSRCRPRSRVASPSMTSPSTSGPGRSPARPGTRPGSAGPASPPSACGAGTARCARSARPARPAASWSCTPATGCCAPPARTGPLTAGCARITWLTGPTWKGPSPRWPPSGAAGSSSATAG